MYLGQILPLGERVSISLELQKQMSLQHEKNVIVEIACFSAAGTRDVNNKITVFYVFSISMGREGAV